MAAQTTRLLTSILGEVAGRTRALRFHGVAMASVLEWERVGLLEQAASDAGEAEGAEYLR